MRNNIFWIVYSIGAHDHTFTTKLLAAYSDASGPMRLIAMEGLNLDEITGYRFAQYYNGSSLQEIWKGRYIPMGDRPIDGLIALLFEYLHSAKQGLAVIEHWIGNRKDPCLTSESRAAHGIKSRIAFYNDDVFYVLAPTDTDQDIAEDTIRGAEHYWLNGVCTSGVNLPGGQEWSEEFLDELVTKTVHIFVSAFDEEGYIVWSPKKRV